MRRTRKLLPLIAVLALAACGTEEAPPAAPAPATGQPAGILCPEQTAKGKVVYVPDGAGATLSGVELGDGQVGAILLHHNGGNVCAWLPYGLELADAGYHVLAVDFPGSGASVTSGVPLEVAAAKAIEYLAGAGCTSTVLLGASMGGTAALVASTEVSRLPVNGVVTLSAPSVFESVNAKETQPKLVVPTLYVAGAKDGDFAGEAETLYNLAPEALSRTKLVVQSAGHGTELLDAKDPASVQVRAELKKWLTDFVPAG